MSTKKLELRNYNNASLRLNKITKVRKYFILSAVPRLNPFLFLDDKNFYSFHGYKSSSINPKLITHFILQNTFLSLVISLFSHWCSKKSAVNMSFFPGSPHGFWVLVDQLLWTAHPSCPRWLKSMLHPPSTMLLLQRETLRPNPCCALCNWIPILFHQKQNHRTTVGVRDWVVFWEMENKNQQDHLVVSWVKLLLWQRHAI